MASMLRSTDYTVDRRGRKTIRIDGLLLLAAFILLDIGLLCQYSVGFSVTVDSNFKKQALWAVVGLVPFFIFALVEPKFWQKSEYILYGINVLVLLAVIRMGETRGGAQRWIELGPIQFQPSEMAKILVCLTLAAFFARRQDSIQSPATFALSFVYVLPVLLLVFKQPHLGATLVIFAIWIAISIAANVPAKFIMIALAIFSLLGVLAVTVPGVLSDYQMERLFGFTAGDENDNAFQSTRAQIAFGVGGVVGSGFLNGEQKKAGFVPEQHNDFIFSVVGEEGGLIGCTLVLMAFAFFFYRIWIVMFQASEYYYKLIAAGIFALLAFHTVANLGMNLQMLPVVGLWLPFLSYGGTALWLCMACVGLLVKIRTKEKPVLF